MECAVQFLVVGIASWAFGPTRQTDDWFQFRSSSTRGVPEEGNSPVDFSPTNSVLLTAGSDPSYSRLLLNRVV